MSESTSAAMMDSDELKFFAFNVWNYKQGEVVSLMIQIGDRLGLYRALDGEGPITAEALAAKTGLKERWLLEWLKNQAAAKLLTYHDGDHFELTPVGAAVLADEENSIAFAAGAFTGATPPETVDKLVEAFKTGIGVSYQDQGPCAAHRTERMLGPWTKMALVPEVIPALDGVAKKLSDGATVVDVGCGAGVALLAMAEVYPNSQFHGYDPSAHAIDRAKENAAKRGITNVTMHCAGGEDLPEETTFDFVITFDCVHDMAFPDKVIASIRNAIKPDGTWLIKDIRSRSGFKENLKNPMLAMLYGFSVSACMSSALSEPGGAGLGTLGFNPEVAEKMIRDAGFTQFKMHDFEEPSNLYYEVRP
jgi:2-polyprenyl-3-methyl-5-hydroxy-6-metoxy-1,4-benzoquinol methylase